MDLLQAIVLGAAQGFTEFLPVSSSGHLVLLQNIFGIGGDVPMIFDIMLHVGTLISVFVVLWKDIWAILRHPLQNKLGMLVLATIPAVVVALLFEDQISTAFDGQYLAYCFYATAAILIVAEVIATRIKAKRQEVVLPNALAMGCMQALAIFPGISRSGSTLAGGLASGLNRNTAARYSFIMSIPVILGSLVVGAKDLKENGMGEVGGLEILVGTAIAAVCGFVAIKFMLNLIQRKRLYGFAIYVACVATFVLLDQNVMHWFFK